MIIQIIIIMYVCMYWCMYWCMTTSMYVCIIVCMYVCMHIDVCVREREIERGRKEGNVLFNDALNTFYLRLYCVGHMVKNHSDIVREETRCCHMGYYFWLAARVLLYIPSHRQNSTYHDLCYTSRGALAGTRIEREIERERERERKKECVTVHMCI